MRKRYVPILLLLALILLFTGCAAKPSVPAAEDHPTVSTLPAETEAPVRTDTQEPAPTEGTGSRLPYEERIDRYDQSIYDGPGYDYIFMGTVPEPGVYTIVEESVDYEGYLWGKLESGIGWVNLTEIQSEHYVSVLISANYANEDLLQSGLYHHYSTGREYAIPIAFHAYGRLRDVALFSFEFCAEGLVPGEDLFTLPEMTGEKPLVAELDFPGDMTTYGIRFVDEAGTTHVYSIYTSGRNGALMLNAE